MSETLALLFFLIMAAIPAVFVWMTFALREPYVKADAWNKGYERGIEQGLREANERRGGPPAPIRIEQTVK